MDNQGEQIITKPQFKPKILFFIILELFLIVTSGLTGYYLAKKQSVNLPINQFNKLISPTQTNIIDETKDWKDYINESLSFKYPPDWIVKNKRISSPNYSIEISVFEINDPIFNECMRLDNEVVDGDKTIKSFSGITTSEMCDPNNLNKKEKWIVKTNGEGYAPGLQYLYKVSDVTFSESIFNQILSSFKFLNNKNKLEITKKLGYIKSITLNYDNYKIAVDYIDWIIDNNSPNGYRIENPSTETKDLYTDVPGSEPKVIMQTYSYSEGGSYNYNQIISFSELLSIFNSNSPLKNVPYWIESKNGTVTQITEQYLP